MVWFDPAHQAVHYPPDRRFRIWIRPSSLMGIGIAILSAIAAAWIEVAVNGLLHVPAVPQIFPNNFAGPHGEESLTLNEERSPVLWLVQQHLVAHHSSGLTVAVSRTCHLGGKRYPYKCSRLTSRFELPARWA